jgi:ferredoxin--NADP+ reductase
MDTKQDIIAGNENKTFNRARDIPFRLMFKIISMEPLAPHVKAMKVEAPDVARYAQAGQFVIIRLHEKGERIPLTLFKTDRKKGTVEIVFQETGKSTYELGSCQPGDELLGVVGPLGKPTEVKAYGKVVVVAGGVGTPIGYAVAKAMHEGGNHVTGIMGFRNKEMVILEDDVKAVCDELVVATDDGSYGKHGFTSDILQELIDEGRTIDFVFTVGPVIMMKVIANLTRQHDIPTVASLNPIMVDGTGMCGACRVCTKQGIQFACVDGPDFNAHDVNFNTLLSRLNEYEEEEQQSLKRYLNNNDK